MTIGFCVFCIKTSWHAYCLILADTKNGDVYESNFAESADCGAVRRFPDALEEKSGTCGKMSAECAIDWQTGRYCLCKTIQRQAEI